MHDIVLAQFSLANGWKVVLEKIFMKNFTFEKSLQFLL